MALMVVMVFLFAGWMLWGWMVSEHRNIWWMKKWCAIAFVCTVMLICVGTGAGLTLVIVKQSHRAEVREFAGALESELAKGNSQRVLAELRSVVSVPDEWSKDSQDLLKRMTASTDRMQESGRRSNKQRQSDIPARVAEDRARSEAY
ncbi:MAG: hypothetical protein KDA91_10910 [Planctomycetaceae bacterium]|nr:hypothetical protein [Planctomycetaceae bacterium]